MQDAIKVSGRDIGAEELLSLVKRDRNYYDNSGGGITVSGGEPMLQWKFLREFLPAVRAEGISVALDTAGNVPWEWYEAVLPFVNLVLLDLKMMDRELHRIYTGVYNDRILDNAEKMMRQGVRMHIRIPLMAGINDTEENTDALYTLVKKYSNVEEIRLLPYHTMGLAKAKSLDMDAPVFQTPDQARLEELKARMDERAVF